MQDDDTANCLAKSKRTKLSLAAKHATCTDAKRAEKIMGAAAVGKAIVSAVWSAAKVRATVIANRRKKAMQDHVRENVEAGSTVYSDELNRMRGLDEIHPRSHQPRRGYVNGRFTPTAARTSGVC